MNDQLAKAAAMPIRTMDDLARLADMFAKSGYFTDARDAAQIGVKVLAGREMGFGPFASVNGVHVIQGKPAIGANLMAAAVKSHPKYDYRVKTMRDDLVEIDFLQDGTVIGTSKFDLADAQAAGTKNLNKFARNMLFARAMSNGVRWFAPDVFMGATVYTPEELGSDIPPDDVPTFTVSPTEAPETITVEVDAPAELLDATAAPIGSERAAKLTKALHDLGVKREVEFAQLFISPSIRNLSELTEEQGKILIAEARNVREGETK